VQTVSLFPQQLVHEERRSALRGVLGKILREGLESQREKNYWKM
jgi:hypothetical protein